MQKRKLSFILVVIFLIGFLAYHLNQKEGKKYVIAVCPTYYDFSETLDKNTYQIKKTGSTAESLDFLKRNIADLVISGRPLKPGEASFDSQHIAKDGFSFLSKGQRTIYVNNFNDTNFCTDLDNLQKELSVKNIYKVGNIMECIESEVVVTSWDNTNYSIFEPVQILNSDRTRYSLSRTPMIHCKDKCQEKILNNLKYHHTSFNK